MVVTHRSVLKGGMALAGILAAPAIVTAQLPIKVGAMLPIPGPQA
jgi:hypothetical protein